MSTEPSGQAVVQRRSAVVPGLDAAAVARRLTRLAFGATIVLSPLRANVVLVALPKPPLYAGYTDLAVAWSEVGAGVTVVLWLASLILARRPVRLGPRFLRLPAAGLVLLALASTAWSIDPRLSAFNAVRLLVIASFALVALNELDAIEQLALPLAAMIAVEAAVGIGQVLAQGSLGLSWLGELSLAPAVTGVSVVATSTSDRLLRAYGLADHPNILGGLLACSLPLLGADVARLRAGARLAGTVILAGGVAALALTFSRSAWVGLGVGILAGVALQLARHDGRSARGWMLASLAGLTVGVAVLLPLTRYVGARADVLTTRVATEQMSLGERSALVAAAERIFLAHPLTGTGFATAPVAMTGALPGLDFDYQPAPVVVLDAAVELGSLGAAAYGTLVVAPFVALWRRRQPWSPALVAATVALAIGGVIGLFDYYPWTFPAGRLWAWLLLGLWAKAYLDGAADHARP